MIESRLSMLRFPPFMQVAAFGQCPETARINAAEAGFEKSVRFPLSLRVDSCHWHRAVVGQEQSYERSLRFPR